MAEEERKDADYEECTCGHFLDTRKSQSEALDGASRGQLPSSGTAKATMDSSFVHLPTHLYQHVDDTIRKPPVASFFASSSKFLETYQHLQEMIRASQSGGDGAMLCPDCVIRYAVIYKMMLLLLHFEKKT